MDTRRARPAEDTTPEQVARMLADIRPEHGAKRCTRIDPFVHLNDCGLTVSDCLTCGQPIDAMIGRPSFYRHVPEARLP
jgi:hypothetical protein